MKQAEHEIMSNVERLFADKKIDLFIGYEKGTLPLRTSPCFIDDRNTVRRLVWNSCCSNNLAVYLPRLMLHRKGKNSKRIGILCKGCDSRSVVELIKEKQVDRDCLYIIGISCSGIIDSSKILSELDGEGILSYDETSDSIVVELAEGERSFPKHEYLYESCCNCAYATPTVYDILIRTVQFAPKVAGPDPNITAFAHKTREERWRIFEEETSKCIRCYACRNACPNCYCKECFAEQTKPRWIGVTNDRSDLLFYHTMRIFHQAGRCVDCGACVRACPMNINLRLFTRVLVDEVKERFGYEPGVSIKEPPPLATFSLNDKQEFMTEPD